MHSAANVADIMAAGQMSDVYMPTSHHSITIGLESGMGASLMSSTLRPVPADLLPRVCCMHADRQTCLALIDANLSDRGGRDQTVMTLNLAYYNSCES